MVNAKSSKTSLIFPVFAILCLTGAIFFQVHQFEFLSFDDNSFISNNPHLKEGLTKDSLSWALSADFLKTSPYIDYWQPVVAISRILDAQFFGLSAGAHHLVNLAFHLANGLLVFFLFYLLTRSMNAALVLMAFFLLHPVQVEVVAWVTARKDLLGTFFGLSSLCSYIFYVKRGSRFFWFLSFSFFTMSLMSKLSFLSLPFLLILLDVWPLERYQKSFGKKNIYYYLPEKIPFFILGAGIFFIVHQSAPMQSAFSTLSINLSNLFVNVLLQLRKIFYPFDLAVYRSVEFNSAVSLPGVLFSVSLLSGVTVLVFKQFKKRPYLFFGWFWFLLTIALTLPIRVAADRFMYVPMLGVFFMLTGFVSDAVGSAQVRRFLIGTGTAALIFMCGALSYFQTRTWRNDLVFFHHSLEVFPDNYIAMGSLGSAYFLRGDTPKAIHYYEEAIRTYPKDALAHLLLANALVTEGEIERANFHFEKAVALKAEYATAEDSLGALL